MPRLPQKLEEIRDQMVYNLWTKQSENFLTAEDIGIIFGMSTMSVYNSIKRMSPVKKPIKKLIN